jgi:FkbM family methyltransferase
MAVGEPKAGGYIDAEELRLIDGLPQGEVTVFDVGANVGEFTDAVLARRPEAHVFAFEADADARHGLKVRLGSSATVLGAVSDSAGRREFYTDSPRSQLGTFFPRQDVPEIAMRWAGSFLTTTVADVVAEHGVDRIDYLKMDCEGSELDVLRGAAPVLDRIDLLSWELLTVNPYTDATVADFEAVLGDEFHVKPLGAEPEFAALWFARRQP